MEPIVGFCINCIMSISLKSFANTQETGQTYTTENCEYFSPEGDESIGSRCYPPDPTGPCSVRSNCRK